jgi:hypothetical protein
LLLSYHIRLIRLLGSLIVPKPPQVLSYETLKPPNAWTPEFLRVFFLRSTLGRTPGESLDMEFQKAFRRRLTSPNCLIQNHKLGLPDGPGSALGPAEDLLKLLPGVACGRARGAPRKGPAFKGTDESLG